MGINIIAKYKEVNLSSFKNLLKMYPYLVKNIKWENINLKTNNMYTEYKNTISLLGSQLGIENRGNKFFEVNDYLFLLSDKDILNYLRYWILTYYVPNPYTENDREPILVWVDICEEILKEEDLEIDYYKYFKEKINEDINIKKPNNKYGEITFKKILIDYSVFLNIRKDGRTLYIEESERELLNKTLKYIKEGFKIPKSYMSKKSFFKRYKVENFNRMFKRKLPDKNYKNLKIDFEKNFEVKKLILEEKERVERMININLKEGKHLILYGDVGVGKTKIAKEICESYDVDYNMTTASSEWSVYETIGGYKIDKDSKMYFDEGIVLDCFKDKENEMKNEWLIIDEINRSDIDKAFSPLFSVLSGEKTKLSFKDTKGEFIELINEEDIEVDKVKSNIYVIPKDWRIVATMNISDKDTLYDMGYAFMRRFAMIPILGLENITEEKVKTLLEIWEIEGDYKFIFKIWNSINKFKKIGPAIIKDLALYISKGGEKQEGIIMYLLPQFYNEEEGFKEWIETLDIDKDYIEKVLREMEN